jgi:transposase
MLTQEEVVEVWALRKRGWTIASIARHLGRSRNTGRRYLQGEAQPGERKRKEDPFARYEKYVAARLQEDPHLWSTALLDEVRKLGYEQSYVTFNRQLRMRGLRPRCEGCGRGRPQPTIEIEHPPGEEIQWDWNELPKAPWGGMAHLLVGTLSHSGRARGVFVEAEDQAHLAEGVDGVVRRLGGTARKWRFDRMATVVDPETGKLRASWAQVAKYYGVELAVCPPRRGQRKGVVEKQIHFSTQRWWRHAEVSTMEQAQAEYDRFCAEHGDQRPRPGGTVATMAAAEPLLALPPQPYPAVVEVTRRVGSSSLVAFRGNQYAVLPGMEGAMVQVWLRLGSGQLEIVAMSGAVVARHRLLPSGAHAVARAPEQRAALEQAVLQAFSTALRCDRKVNRPPGEAAKAAAAELIGVGPSEAAVDLERYAEFARVAR